MSIFSGTYQVTVFTPPTGGGESNSLPITVVGNAPAYPTINVQSGVPGVVDGAGFTNKSGLAPGTIASLFGTGSPPAPRWRQGSRCRRCLRAPPFLSTALPPLSLRFHQRRSTFRYRGRAVGKRAGIYTIMSRY